ncbi:MAG: putative outer membrane protein, partial [Bacteroidota bacterium]
KNIGPLVNGAGDEHYFTIDSKSRNLFYARSDENKNIDLFSFPLPMEAQPTATTEFSGVLKDSVTGKSYQGIVSVIDLENGIEVAPKFVREDGTFSFDLIDNQKYLLIIQGEDFFRIEKEIKLQGDTVFEVKAQGIKSYRIQFSTIEFANNSFEILEEMKPDLDKLVDYLLDNPTVKLTISGHTDSKGNPEKNQQLSQKRAESIREYLITTGDIDPDRIKALGYGSSKPIKKVEVTDEDRKLNRRVEFEIDRGEEGSSDDSSIEELKEVKKEED